MPVSFPPAGPDRAAANGRACPPTPGVFRLRSQQRGLFVVRYRHSISGNTRQRAACPSDGSNGRPLSHD
eukprot:5293523-Pyramimonas_sp.AAC.1